MKKPMIDIAVLGLGTVGNGVYEVIAGNGPHIARSLGGEALRIKRVLDLRTFDTHPLRGVVTNDFACILGDPDIRVVVETMGGLHPAYEFSKAALESGRSVVTSNKAVVEEYGRELTETARQNGVYYLYEAAVGGDATGMLYLGHRYYYGQDVACDQAEGIRWYHRAAEAGSDAAMSRLAQIYEADKHYKEAARWYRRYAAERIRWRNQRLNW